MTPVIADAIGLKYGRLFFWAKTIFHAERIKVEIICFKILTTYYYRYIHEMESELKYITGLKKT